MADSNENMKKIARKRKPDRYTFYDGSKPPSYFPENGEVTKNFLINLGSKIRNRFELVNLMVYLFLKTCGKTDDEDGNLIERWGWGCSEVNFSHKLGVLPQRLKKRIKIWKKWTDDSEDVNFGIQLSHGGTEGIYLLYLIYIKDEEKNYTIKDIYILGNDELFLLMVYLSSQKTMPFFDCTD